MTKKKRNKSNDYVNNEEFLKLMCAYIEKRKYAELNDEPKPELPYEVSVMIMKIAEKLSNSPKFSNYTYKEDMIGDAIENCIRYVDNFDPEKSKNPFAYFTQMIYFAFLRRIKSEQKYMYEKYKAIEKQLLDNQSLDDEISGIGADKYGSDFSDLNMREYISNYEEKKKKKKKSSAAKKKALV